jgi:hypothetical protein
MSELRPTSGAALCVHEPPEYVYALLSYLMEEYSRVYWNVFQDECPLTSGGSYGAGRSDDMSILSVPGLVVRSYWWGDDLDPRAQEVNWDFAGVAFTWYKNPMRGLETNIEQNAEEWAAWFTKCSAAIGSADIW